MSSSAWANQTIPRPTKGVRLVKERYSLRDIAKLCHRAFLEDNWMMKEFAKAFSPDMHGLRKLFDFVDQTFDYNEDRAFDGDGDELAVQAVQSPAAMWHVTRNGDCKSFTVLIACALHHMGLPVILRLVGYVSKTDYHIYPVAVLNGKEVPLDVVFKKQQNGAFGTEKIPMKKVQDILEAAGLYKVGTTMQQPVTSNDLMAAVNQINATFSDISDSVIDDDGGDVTEMTQGQFDVWLFNRGLKAADMRFQDLSETDQAKVNRHKAINTKPAFSPVRLALPPVQDEVSGLKDVLDKVKEAVQKALKKLANAFHKEDAHKVGPFFLYQFLTPAQLAKAKPEVRRRHAAQAKILDTMVKKGKLGSREQILASMKTGFIKKHKVTPEEVLAAVTTGQAKVGVVGVAVTAAVSWIGSHKEETREGLKALGNLLGKLFKIFKKKDKDDEAAEAAAAEANASDISMLEGALNATSDESGSDSTDAGDDDSSDTEGKDNTMLYVGGAALLALLLLKK